MSITDGQWFWASEHGRDRLLRESVEMAASSAARDSRRLRSRLAEVQGSLESRIDALTAAFDAYVELGDVRQQINELPDTRRARAAVAQRMEQLVATGSAEPIDPAADGDIWLVHAVNAVIARIDGAPDRAAEQRAATESAEAPAFIALVLGALGHGASIQPELADLMISDQHFGPNRATLWQGIIAGHYGPAALEQIASAITPVLSRSDWSQWTPFEDKPTVADTALTLVDHLDHPETLTHAGSQRLSDEARSALKERAGELTVGLTPAERELYARAEELRRRIEEPGARAEEREPRVDPTDLVRSAVLDERVEPSLRLTLARWILAELQPAVAALPVAEVPNTSAMVEKVTVEGVEIDVTTAGADDRGRRRALTAIERRSQGGGRPDRIGMGLAGAGVLALVLAAFTSWWFLALVIVLVGVGGFLIVRHRQQVAERENSKQFFTRRLERDITEAEERVQARRAEIQQLELSNRGREAALASVTRALSAHRPARAADPSPAATASAAPGPAASGPAAPQGADVPTPPSTGAIGTL